MPTKVINIKDAPRQWQFSDEFIWIGPNLTEHGGPRFTKWNNGFHVGDPHPRTSKPMTQDDTCDQYALDARRSEDIQRGIHEGELRGKTLVCTHHPTRCHGHILASWSNSLFEKQEG